MTKLAFIDRVRGLAERKGFEFKINRNGNPEIYFDDEITQSRWYHGTHRVGIHFTLQTGTVRRRYYNNSTPYKFGRDRHWIGISLDQMSDWLDKKYPEN